MAEIKDCPFLRLPTEIRLQIYAHLYIPPEGQYPVETLLPIWGHAPIWLHKFEYHHGQLYPASDSTKRAFWALLQTCKVVNQELSDLLFERMVFAIYFTLDYFDGLETPNRRALSLARYSTFWQRARRTALIGTSIVTHPMKDLVWALGNVFRYFRSDPSDTKVHLSVDGRDLELFRGAGSKEEREWRRCLESVSNLAKRASFDIVLHTNSGSDIQKFFVDLSNAMDASATQVAHGLRTSGLQVPRNEEYIISTETVRTRSNSGLEMDTIDANRKRTVCWMSHRMRASTSQNLALKRRKEYIMMQKRLYEGRLG